MIIDGKKIADEIIGELAARRDTLLPVLRLGVVMGAQDAATASFVRIKERVADRLRVGVVREMLDEQSTTEQALRAVERLASATDGIIVQLPLPGGLDTDKVLAAIPPERDVDGVNPLIADADRPVRAPVAEAVGEVLERAGVDVRGKTAVVVGAGRLVGLPSAELLKALGADVSMVTESRGSLEELKTADIAVLGAGKPAMVKPEMLKPGIVLIDAGTSEAGGRVAGDADPACADVASVFTPVPGGVGPIAVAMIFKNLFALAKK